MFLEYYGLKEQPFGVTPDPKYLYLSGSHREALASLHYEVETRRGFSALVAEPGMGKTSLLVRLLDSLKSSARTAFIFQTNCDPQGFLRGLLKDLGIPGRGKDLSRMNEALNKALLEEMQAGRKFVVVVDEAQNLDDKVLESIRLLSNFETPTAKLMHVVLAGQPQLADRLERPELAQLKQRVGSIVRIERFSPKETSTYIEHRLRVAGHKGAQIFSPEAHTIIARASQGIPRNINNLCFEALSLGFATRSSTVDGKIVREVLADREVNVGPKTDTLPGPARSEKDAAEDVAWPRGIFADRPEFRSLGRDSQSTAAEQGSEFSLGKLGVGFLMFVVVPLLVVFVLIAAKVGLSGTTDEIAARVAGISGPAALPAPALPATLKAPKPVALAYTQPEPKSAEPPAATTDSNDPPEEQPAPDQSESPNVVSARAGDTLFDLAQRYYGRSDWTIVEEIRSLNRSIREPDSRLREGQQISLPEDEPRRAGGGRGHTTTEKEWTQGGSVVVLPRQETAFDIAHDYMGKQDWATIEEIRALNPRIGEPYAAIPAGTRIVLPSRKQPRSPGAAYASGGNTGRQ